MAGAGHGSDNMYIQPRWGEKVLSSTSDPTDDFNLIEVDPN